MEKDKEQKFHFYRLNSLEASKSLSDFLTNCVMRDENPAHKISDDGYIQIQELNFADTQRDQMVHGIVKKFNPKATSPVIGKIGKGNERPVPMTDDEGLVEKTFFLYNLAHGILLHHSNRGGTSAKKLGQYLEVLCDAQFGFDPVLTHSGYKLVREGKMSIKKLVLKVARPTSVAQIKNADDKWANNQMQILDHIGGYHLYMEVKGNFRGREDKFLSPTAWSFLHSFMGMFGDKDGGNVVLVDEDNIEHPIDLVADRLIDAAHVPMRGKYPESEAMFREMRRIMLAAKPELDLIFGNSG